MGLITVEVWDATGNKKRQVEMPDDAPMRRLLAVLIDKMSFPQNGPDGQLLSYKCQHRNTGKQLLDEQTLAEVGVRDGDVLRLLPEITAGYSFLTRYGRERVRVSTATAGVPQPCSGLVGKRIERRKSFGATTAIVAGPHLNPLPAIPGEGT